MKISTISKRIFLFTITFSLIMILSGCSDTKKPAIGEEDEIIVVADSLEYIELEGELLQVFSKIIYTPQPEHLFQLKRKSVNLLDDVKNKKNIIIIAPINSGSYTSKYLRGILDSTVTNLVETDSVFVINRHELWAANQLVMILTAPSMERLKERLLLDNENLIYQFRKKSDDRLFQSIYNEKYEQKNIEAQLLRDYGWMIYIQADYFVAKNDSSSNFLWLRRSPGSDMERWVFVHWIENATPDLLNRDSITSIRNRLTEKYYRTTNDSSWVEIADDYKTTKEVNFNGKYALSTQGLWRMTDQTMGGPFINYTFYDEQSKRLYMLDGSVYAPKYYKKKLIQQLDVTLHSFLTENEVDEKRKLDLYKYLE